MRHLVHRKWHLALIGLIAVAIIVGLAIGPLAVKVFGTVAGLYLILFIVLKGIKDPGGKVNPWHYQSGAGRGNGGGFGP